ncbi:MAG: hypothetical protein ACRD4H_11055 [Candidatus Acidiferrales bacterium]
MKVTPEGRKYQGVEEKQWVSLNFDFSVTIKKIQTDPPPGKVFGGSEGRNVDSLSVPERAKADSSARQITPASERHYLIPFREM